MFMIMVLPYHFRGFGIVSNETDRLGFNFRLHFAIQNSTNTRCSFFHEESLTLTNLHQTFVAKLYSTSLYYI